MCRVDANAVAADRAGFKIAFGNYRRLPAAESKLLREVPSRFGAPESVADFDAGGDVDDEREATVVAQQPRLATDGDEAFDLRGIWINGHQGSGYGAEFTQVVAIETPPGNTLGLASAAKEVAVSRIRFYRLADHELDLESAFVLLFRETNNMASHAFLSGRKCLHLIGGEGERDGNEHD